MLVTEFTESLNFLMQAMNPESEMDLYCRGVVFGNKGSMLLVRVANLLKNEKFKSGDLNSLTVPKKDSKNKKKAKKGKAGLKDKF